MICLCVFSRVKRCSKYKEIFKKNNGNLIKLSFIIVFKIINKFSCYITIIILFLSIINQIKIDFDDLIKIMKNIFYILHSN